MMSNHKHNTKLFAALLAVLIILSTAFAPMALATGVPAASAVTTPTPAPAATPTPAPVGGTPFITAYTVQNSAGQELQKINAGEKCQIVIGICDPRYTAIPAKTDGYGNIANAKITSTGSFASPSLGDIRFTTPTATSDGVKYSIIFNDITYIGGSSELSFDLAYVAQDTPLVALSQKISQCSASGAASSSIKPSVMVKDSSYGKASVDAGETFTLNLTSYNTSSAAAISNVTTTLTLPEELTLAGGSNSIMTSTVAAGGSFANAFQLMAQPGAPTGIANITVQYTYYSGTEESQMTSSQIITVSIIQPDRFSFSSMDVPAEMYTGEENSISLGFVNKGKGILYNVSAEISGNLKNPGQSQYLGNLQPGAEGSVDFVIGSDAPATVSGTVTITYEDIAGNQKTQTKEYSVDIKEMPAYDDPMAGMDPNMGMEEPPSQGLPIWGWALIIVAVIVVAVVVLKVLKKRKAKKELLELEAEDEDN